VPEKDTLVFFDSMAAEVFNILSPCDSGQDFRILFVGGVGNGKSSIIKKLMEGVDKSLINEKPVSGVTGGGITKNVESFPLNIGVNSGKEWGFDTPGAGDKDAKLPFVVGQIESALGQGGVHAIVICEAVSNFRIGLGVQVTSMVLKKGLLEHNKGDKNDALKRIILCGTKVDMVTKRQKKQWLKKVAPTIKDYLGGLPGAIVTTGLAKQAGEEPNSDSEEKSDEDNDEDLEDNIIKLKSALRKIGNLRSLEYKAPTSLDLINALAESTGLDIDEKLKEHFMQVLDQERANNLKEMKEQYEEFSHFRRLYGLCHQEQKEKEKELQQSQLACQKLLEKNQKLEQKERKMYLQQKKDRDEEAKTIQKELKEMRKKHESELKKLQPPKGFCVVS